MVVQALLVEQCQPAVPEPPGWLRVDSEPTYIEGSQPFRQQLAFSPLTLKWYHSPSPSASDIPSPCHLSTCNEGRPPPPPRSEVLTFEEATELSTFGLEATAHWRSLSPSGRCLAAQVVHPAAMIPVCDAGVPVCLRNLSAPSDPGHRASHGVFQKFHAIAFGFRHSHRGGAFEQ